MNQSLNAERQHLCHSPSCALAAEIEVHHSSVKPMRFQHHDSGLEQSPEYRLFRKC